MKEDYISNIVVNEEAIFYHKYDVDNQKVHINHVFPGF